MHSSSPQTLDKFKRAIQQFLFPYRAFRGSPVFPAILQAMDETTLGFRGAVLANLMPPPPFYAGLLCGSPSTMERQVVRFSRVKRLSSALPLSCKR